MMNVGILTLWRRRPISYRNQSIDLQSKSMDWFLYDIGLHCERVKVVVESLLETLTKRRSQTFSRSIDLHSVINAVGKNISSMSNWNLVNQLGKHDFPCGWIFLVGRKYSIWKGGNVFQMKRNCLDSPLVRVAGIVVPWRI